MKPVENQDIRLFIMKCFNDDDLETFCFDYFPDVGNNFTTGMTKNNKVMQVITHCRNRQEIERLLVSLQKERPQPYQTTFAVQETVLAPPPPKTKPRNPKQIFISHATADAAELANKLADDLRADGHPVWIAPTSIAHGEKWGEAIQRGLQESGIFLLLLTPAAVNSHWVKIEMASAMRLHGRGQMRILPLTVQKCDVPLFWEAYQFLDFHDAYTNGWNRLHQALAGNLPSSSKVTGNSRDKKPTPPAEPKPDQCTATTKSGSRCRNKALDGTVHCGVHTKKPKVDAPPAPPQPEAQLELLYIQLLEAQTNGKWTEMFMRAVEIDKLQPDYRNVAALYAVALQQLQKPKVDDAPQKIDMPPQVQVNSPSPSKVMGSSGGDTFVHEKTGLEFVRIPVGEFMYSNKAVQKKKFFGGYKTEYEAGKIELPEFWMCKTPVTNAVYKRFIDANPNHDVPIRDDDDMDRPYNWDKNKRTFSADKAEHPVVFVSWYDAVAFCEWAGLELPTEEQWEKAARGTKGLEYPWGNNEPTDKLCNFNQNVGKTSSVGNYSPQGDSPYGCVDMSGNVWEWCLNKYSTPEDIKIDESDERRVLRGGSWGGRPDGVRAACRRYGAPGFISLSFGFRVVAVRRASSH